MKPPDIPKKYLAGLDADAAASLIAATADVALMVDRNGVIRDLVFCGHEFALDGHEKWLGKRWLETVTVESRPKVEAILRDVESKVTPRWRQLNHPATTGADIPMLYSALRVGKEGDVVVFGRDLRATAALQQRLMDAQQSMERDYWRLRHLETRYRLLFQMATEAVLIVDATNQKVVEANSAAGQLLGEGVKRLVGRAFPDGFDSKGTRAIQVLLASIAATGKAEEVEAHLSDSQREFIVSASLFRQENASFFMVRLTPLAQAPGGVAAIPKTIQKIVESAPDGFVVTEPDGRILVVNRAFLDLAQLVKEDQAKGESLDRWLGRAGVDFGVLISNLRKHGSVRLFATTIRGEHGTSVDVEISAVSVSHGEQPCLGFTIRDVGRRLVAASPASKALPRSVEQLAELVGRVPLKDLVQESTDLIERLCIEAALELTHDNRASAAEMLGLSRQGFYVKLRRHGLGDLTPAAERNVVDMVRS